jgi:hypothetical protein
MKFSRLGHPLRNVDRNMQHNDVLDHKLNLASLCNDEINSTKSLSRDVPSSHCTYCSLEEKGTFLLTFKDRYHCVLPHRAFKSEWFD